MSKLKPQYIVLALVALLFAAVLIPSVTSDRPGRLVSEDGAITRTIAVLDTDASAAFSVRTLEGADPEHESGHMFDALSGLPGLGKASLDTQELVLEVTYDSAVIDEATIRSRLVEVGYIAPTREDTPQNEAAPDGVE